MSEMTSPEVGAEGTEKQKSRKQKIALPLTDTIKQALIIEENELLRPEDRRVVDEFL